MIASPYFLEYIRLEMVQNPEAATNHWAAEFKRSQAAFNYDQCQQLLVGVKSLGDGLPGEAQAIIWHCHGGLLHQLQRWEEAVGRTSAACPLSARPVIVWGKGRC
jgi:hypothetical protein